MSKTLVLAFVEAQEQRRELAQLRQFHWVLCTEASDLMQRLHEVQPDVVLLPLSAKATLYEPLREAVADPSQLALFSNSDGIAELVAAVRDRPRAMTDATVVAVSDLSPREEPGEARDETPPSSRVSLTEESLRPGVSAVDPGSVEQPVETTQLSFEPTNTEEVSFPALDASPLESSQLGQYLAERVEHFHAGLGAASPHQLLGLKPGANADLVKQAYFNLAIEFHPDRFYLLPAAHVHPKVSEIYEHLTRAKDTLLSSLSEDDGLVLESSAPPQSEGREDVWADRPQSTTERVWFDRAEAAFARGDVQQARFFLIVLVSQSPEHQGARRALQVVEARIGPTVDVLELPASAG